MRGKCGICLRSLSAMHQNTNASSIVTTMCGHVFHGACIKTWIAQNPTCATCRKRVEEKDLVKLFIDFCDDKSKRTLLDEFKEKLHAKDLECISKDKKITEMQTKCAGYESEILRKHKQIHEHHQRQIKYACSLSRSQMEFLQIYWKMQKLEARCALLETEISVKDRKIEEFQTRFSCSELQSSKEDKKLKEIQASYARLKLKVSDEAKMIEEREIRPSWIVCNYIRYLESLSDLKEGADRRSLGPISQPGPA